MTSGRRGSGEWLEAFETSQPECRFKTGSGRMNRLELPHAHRGPRGRISLFCLMWACHHKGYKYKRVVLELKAPHGTE